MNKASPNFRIGNGYDIHRLVEGRNLIIGGIKLNHPENLGLDGHSDADVLSHSIMDALLGALSLGDIGKYFPPSDQKWKNADSLFLLSKVIGLIRKQGWEINNIDSVIVAERPKILPYVEQMKKNISKTLQIEDNLIGVKATTNEKLGPEGREEGISCHSVVLLEKKKMKKFYMIKDKIRNFCLLVIFLLVFLFQSNFQNQTAIAMDNYRNALITEELRLKVPSKFKEVWLKTEKKVWEPWLSIQDGFLGRQIFWDKEREEALILVYWKNKELWKSISMKEVNKMQDKFEDDVKTSLNVNVNPFELIYEGELVKQG